MKELKFSTRQIHGRRVDRNCIRPLVTPIYQSSTFTFDTAAQGAALFAGEEEGFFYTRIDNPNNCELAMKLADLEGAEAGVVFSSGMGAVCSLVWSLARSGAHVLADKTLYGCTHEFFEEALPRYGVEVDFVDLSGEGAVRAHIRDNTALLYFETPANPNLKLLDIEALSREAHSLCPGIKVVVDNTFATPYLQQPLSLGADLVLHSATKYLNGHGDVIAGAVLGSEEDIALISNTGLRYLTGSVLGPFEAFLITRGLKTLDLRMERHCRNAEKIARWLEEDPRVSRVWYPGLSSHPDAGLARRQMKLPGAVIAFELPGDRERCSRFIDALSLCQRAVSLGDAETLIQHPASMTHSTYSPEALKDAGISETLIRLSVGLEDPDDILADIDAALKG